MDNIEDFVRGLKAKLNARMDELKEKLVHTNEGNEGSAQKIRGAILECDSLVDVIDQYADDASIELEGI